MWLEHVRDLAHTFGWVTYHPHQSQRSEPGFPDLVLCKHRIVYVELKRDPPSAKLSPHQERWRGFLLATGAEWYCLRPRHAELLPLILRPIRPYLTPEQLLDMGVTTI